MLRIKGIGAGYNGLEVLKDVSVEVTRGEVVAVVGRNGSGKSTLLKCIAGTLLPLTGRIVLEEQDVLAYPIHQRARLGITYVPQGRRLFSRMTVRENLELGLLARKIAARDISPRMERVLDVFPVLSGLLSRRVAMLSGGQQQLVTLGQAIILDPKVLLLDEPSLGLQDPKVVEEVYHYITKLASLGLALLLVEQYVSIALKVSHRFYLLDEGRVVSTGESKKFDTESSFSRRFLDPGPDSLWNVSPSC